MASGYYRNISIDPDIVAQLPEYGDLSGLCTITVNSSGEEDPLQEEIDPTSQDHFVPSAPRRSTEVEAV